MKTLAALALVLTAAAGGCGRRGPPLAPLQVDPETPRVLPLRQEDGAVVVRWFAPRLDSGGDPADLRLRKAIVSYRIVDLHALAAEERAAQRRPPEEEEEEPEDTPAGDEDAAEVPEPESPEPAEEAAPDAVAPETGEIVPGQPPVAAEAQPPAGEPPPGEAETEPEQEAETAPEAEQEAEAETEPELEAEAAPEAVGETEPDEPQEAAGAGEPPGEEAGGETPEQAPEPEAGAEPEPEPAAEVEPEPEPEPEGTLLDYEELEFEVLSEIESEVPGEEQVLELPVEPDWVGRRLEITVRYEARGGASEESELQSLDVTGPLPAVEGVLVEVGPRELTIRWEDPRGALAKAPVADPVFEVFRRRGEESERLGRSFGPSQTDADVVWGEEVCYGARLVVAGAAEERVLPDPGPVAPADPEGDASAAEPPAPDQDAAETPAPDETVAAGAPETPEAEPEDPEAEAAPVPDEPEAEEDPWTPIPIRVPGAGTGALSVGPMSAEECVVPVDAFPPVPPSDLRLFWRSEATELSWRDSASTDVAGYHVYRTGPDGTGFQRLTESLVEQTSYTDAARDPRGAYRYAVTAVDGADPPNESLPSDPATANPR